MGSSSSKSSKPVVVIIGGGFGGVRLATLLDSDFHVVILERKNYFLFTFATLRAAADPSLAPSILIPYNRLLDSGLVVTHAHVEEITSEGVKVMGLDSLIKYDYLVMATGSSFGFPMRVAPPDATDALKAYNDVYEALTKCSKVIVVGGGAAGVELMGELSDLLPEGKLTLIHSRDHLIPGDLTQRYKDEVLRQLRAMPNVEVILGDRLVFDPADLQTAGNLAYIRPQRPVTTQKGQTLEADLVFFCGGGKVNSASLKPNFADLVDESGHVKVNQFLQVEGLEKVFALGDCNNVKEFKRGVAARRQAGHVAQNIRAHLAGRPLAEYYPKSAGLILTIGKHGGAIQPPLGLDIVVGAFPAAYVKTRDLGAAGTWRRMGTSKPSEFTAGKYTEEVAEEKLQRWEEILGVPKEQLLKVMRSSAESSESLANGRC